MRHESSIVRLQQCVDNVQLLYLPFHSNRKPANALSNLLRLGIREIQAKVAEALLAVGVKRVAGYKRHILLERHFKQFLRIHPLRQSHPKEQPALGMGSGNFRREEFL